MAVGCSIYWSVALSAMTIVVYGVFLMEMVKIRV